MTQLVRHVMTAAPPARGTDMTAADAADVMRTLDVGAVPVVDGDELVGLVTDRDIVLRVVAERADPSAVRLGDIASAAPITVSPDASLADARELMANHRVRRLPVMKEGRLVGIVALGDVAVRGASERATGHALEEISRSGPTEHTNPGPDVGTPERARP